MEINIAKEIDLDPQNVLTGRCCIIGQSGSGKSYLVGVIVEELCKAGLPFAIIDTEGEYASLKSAFRIILVGEDGADLPTDTDPSRLFRSSIEGNVPIVFDISEVLEKDKYVDSILTSLYKTEDKIRSPYLVIIEEADKFCPQVVRKERNPIEEISVRGRKRGIGLMVATQRPANISKNVLAQCSYGFIGKLTTENDIRAIDILFEDKKRLLAIPKLSTGEFTAFGLGYDDPFHIKQRSVLHTGSTPRIRKEALVGDPEEIIAMLKKGSQAGASTAASTPAMQTEKVRISVIDSTVTEEDAKRYANRIAQKRFLVFGGAVERIDSISRNYLCMVLCKVRVPTRRSGTYEERYALIDSKMNAVGIGKRISTSWFGGEKPLRLTANERKVLKELNTGSSLAFDKIVRLTGMEDTQVSRSLSRLERTGLADRRKDRFSPSRAKAGLAASAPAVSEQIADTDSIVGFPSKFAKAAKDRVSMLFPDSVVVSADLVYLPFYRITLRKGNRVKVASIDAVLGRPLDTLVTSQ